MVFRKMPESSALNNTFFSHVGGVLGRVALERFLDFLGIK